MVAVGMLVVAGVAVGAISLSATTEYARGDYSGFNGAVPGVGFSSTVAGTVPNPPPVASTGSGLLPQFLAPGANVFCASTCIAGDVSLNETYAFTTTLSGAIQITVAITAGGVIQSVTLDLRQSLLPTFGVVVVEWDLGTSISALTAVTGTLHHCSGLTCP
jgi:hypothetical protein